MTTLRFGLMALGLAATAALAQAPYVWTLNPGPGSGTKWMVKPSNGVEESSTAVVMDAPKPVWVRVCYSVGPSESVVTVYSQRGQADVNSTELAWGGCADVFGRSIWVGNGHTQVVGGYYGIAPATPAD